MAIIDKIKVGSTTYDVSPSASGTLNTTGTTKFASSDTAQASATSWTNVDQMTTSDNHATLFTKITQMAKNVRYLYNVLGTGFSTGSTVKGQIDGKAPANHSHSVSQLPTSSTQVNSSDYIPTSALIYSMNQTLTSLNDAYTQEVADRSNRNKEYQKIDIQKWTNIDDVSWFFGQFNHNNNYTNSFGQHLKLGMGIVIQDGTYNATWDIAGFDMETSHIAADGTTVDNGYGIYLLPRTSLGNSQMWGTYNQMPAGYLGCTPMQNTLADIQSKLEAVLGDHLVNRKVYLSTAANDNGSTAGKWTNAKLTLMSLTQIDGRGWGSVGSHYCAYDVGEATQKLPLFNYERYWLPYREWYWTRGLYGKFSWQDTIYAGAWRVGANGDIGGGLDVSGSYGVRPLIYVKA